jgi:hypothetical protein
VDAYFAVKQAALPAESVAATAPMPRDKETIFLNTFILQCISEFEE